jgi:predicted ATP-dependent endonuclease of OLD family
MGLHWRRSVHRNKFYLALIVLDKNAISTTMKICKIYIKGFQQFQDVELDFTNPETGEPLEKVCFIGSNGTGKSTVLKMMQYSISKILEKDKSEVDLFGPDFKSKFSVIPLAIFIYNRYGKIIHHVISSYQIEDYIFLASEIVVKSDEIQTLNNGEQIKDFLRILKVRHEENNTFKNVVFDQQASLCIYSPSEATQNSYLNIVDVPVANVNQALEFFLGLPVYNEVSQSNVNDFWKLLIYLLKHREDERNRYENLPENVVKIKMQLIEEFDKIHPKILQHIAGVWDKILEKCGLFLDYQNAINPVQLSDNLKVYIRLRNEANTNINKLDYSRLSTGIRNFIFRLGHIYALHFNRIISYGFLLVDEPENSLFPDFLFDLVEAYQKVILDESGRNNTQMFFATHNPIIAAQFKPYERIILAWNDDGTVKTYKGDAPEGDDPNDVLKKDFGVRELMGQKGIEEWNKYLDLKSQLKKANNIDKKMALAAEINKIGRLYDFPA